MVPDAWSRTVYTAATPRRNVDDPILWTICNFGSLRILPCMCASKTRRMKPMKPMSTAKMARRILKKCTDGRVIVGPVEVAPDEFGGKHSWLSVATESGFEVMFSSETERADLISKLMRPGITVHGFKDLRRFLAECHEFWPSEDTQSLLDEVDCHKERHHVH
jgi:hypothetical protein